MVLCSQGVNFPGPRVPSVRIRLSVFLLLFRWRHVTLSGTTVKNLKLVVKELTFPAVETQKRCFNIKLYQE